VEVPPCDPVTPTYAFAGEEMMALPAINFPVSQDLAPVAYTLNLSLSVIDRAVVWPRFGEVFNVPDDGIGVVKVYRLQPLNYTLNADQAARDIAKKLEFSAVPKILDSRTLLFMATKGVLEENLQIDLKTMFLTLDTNALTTTNAFGVVDPYGNKMFPDPFESLTAVKNYLAKGGILPSDLSDTEAVVGHYKSAGASLELVENTLETDYTMVLYPRRPLNGLVNYQPGPGRCENQTTAYKFYGPEGFGSIRAVVGRNVTGEDVVVELEDYYYEMDYDNTATYPIRPVAEAWQLVTAGQAYIVNPRGVQNAVFNRVELGYYESHQEQEYLLPIYVFAGENGVMAYVSALHPSVVMTN
jgi:hypothetical protein